MRRLLDHPGSTFLAHGVASAAAGACTALPTAAIIPAGRADIASCIVAGTSHGTLTARP